MTRLALLLLAVALTPVTGVLLAAVVLALAGAAVGAAVWSRRVDPSPWFPPPDWDGAPIR